MESYNGQLSTTTWTLVELPPVLANGGIKNEVCRGRGPRSAQRTKSRVAVSNLLFYQYFTTERCNPSEKELSSKFDC
jgi:hypothetical protein